MGAWQSDEVVARAKPVAISRVPSLCSGQGFVISCLPQAGTPRNDPLFGSLHYPNRFFQIDTACIDGSAHNHPNDPIGFHFH
jgi:hypothetical protein